MEANDGGLESSVNFSRAFQKKKQALLNLASPWESEAEFSEKSFKKAQQDPSARSQLENIHSARAFQYGSSHFGPKSWYKDNSDIALKFQNQRSRSCKEKTKK